MTIILRRLFIILFPIVFLNACTSGATSSKAGGAGTSTGTTGLILFAELTPENFITGSSDGLECLDWVKETELGTLKITIQDPDGIYRTQSQGITFDTYTLVFDPINQGIPIPLKPRSYGLTKPVALNGASTTTTSFLVVLVDLETKEEYATRDSGSYNTYNITLTYQGRDFISGAPVTLVVTTQLELGCEDIEEEEEVEPEEEVEVEP